LPSSRRMHPMISFFLSFFLSSSFLTTSIPIRYITSLDLSIHSFIRSFVHSFIHLFICSFVRLFVHSANDFANPYLTYLTMSTIDPQSAQDYASITTSNAHCGRQKPVAIDRSNRSIDPSIHRSIDPSAGCVRTNARD
jgi:hypothetical protein